MSQDIYINFWLGSLAWAIPIGIVIGAFFHGYYDCEDAGLSFLGTALLSALWPLTVSVAVGFFIWATIAAVGDYVRSTHQK